MLKGMFDVGLLSVGRAVRRALNIVPAKGESVVVLATSGVLDAFY